MPKGKRERDAPGMDGRSVCAAKRVWLAESEWWRTEIWFDLASWWNCGLKNGGGGSCWGL